MKANIFLLLLFFPCVLSAQLRQESHTQYVNLFIGTGGHGHTHPGALVPHGMIQPGPDTRIHDWDASSGYHYDDTIINGFAHTRLSGTGCADFGDFLLMPFTGTPCLEYVGEKGKVQNVAYASSFSHANELAMPGYYSVFLDRYGIRVELTATERTAMHRYTFPDTAQTKGVILDLDYSIQEQTNEQMCFEQVDSVTVRAYKRNVWWAYCQDIYFIARFSRPIKNCHELTDTVIEGTKSEPRHKAILTFDLLPGEQLLVKSSISSIDHNGARRNLEAEQPAWAFEETRRMALAKWEKCLSKIDITTPDSDLRTIFYTALYHANISPSIFCDVDGRYLGMDLKSHQGSAADPMYTIFSLWDTFRALHPLISIIAPEENEAYIRSLIQKGKDGGLVPKWDCVANYTGCMLGYHYVSLLADSYVKGYRDYNVEDAYKAALRCAEYDTTGITPACPRWLYPYIMPVSRYYKKTLGYAPCDKDKEAVSKALEYAYDDWCISQLASALGDKENSEKYVRYAKGYENYFDPQTGFMRGKLADGTWREPFDPRRSDHREDDYCEGNAYQWSWFAPHDVPGLMKLYGGKKKFISRLNGLFSASSEMSGDKISADISGLIGQYAHGNEPSHHIIHLFNYAGQAHRTQELIDSVLFSLYHNAPNGLSGNEDCGQMSAWYVLNAMGFYQVCPGNPTYSIGRPIFDEADIHLPGGNHFRIVTKNNSRSNKYIRRMTLNGRRLTEPFFTHGQLVQGGTLEIEMADKPE